MTEINKYTDSDKKYYRTCLDLIVSFAKTSKTTWRFSGNQSRAGSRIETLKLSYRGPDRLK